MEKYKYIEPFNISGEIGDFLGAYIFTYEKYCFLLNSQNGCSIILENILAEQILNHKIFLTIEVKIN